MSELLLNRYRVIDHLGSGGFASVVVAWDTRIRRNVAIKCIPLGDALSRPKLPLFDLEPKHDFFSPFRKTQKQEAATNLPVLEDEISPHSIITNEALLDEVSVPGLEEARTAAMLSDQNIVSVYDFEIQGDYAYLILEYVEGLTLGELLEHYPDEIDADIAAAIFKAVSHALQVAHKNKVLHLDIKPDNVLIDQEGRVKVTDFGLARLAGEAGFGAAAGGTIGYMPPEQMRQEDLDPRCDEWALASLMYEIMSGSNPFIVPRLEQAEAVIADAEIVVPSLCMDGIHESADDIMFCALDPDREERYDSVSDFARELKQCLGDPRKGTKKLARIVGDAYEEDEEPQVSGEESAKDGWAFLPRDVSSRSKSMLSRAISVICIIPLLVITLGNIDAVLAGGWANPMAWGVAAVAVILTAIFPHIGAALCLISCGVMLCFNNAILAGVLLVLLAGVWWFFVARFDSLVVNVTMSVVPLGAIGLGPLMPLLAGYFLRARDAVLAALFGLFIAFVLGGLGSASIFGWDMFGMWDIRMWTNINETLLAMLQSPVMWLFAFVWLLASFVMSVFCARGSRVLGIVGVVVSIAVLLAGPIIAALIMSAGTSFIPDWQNVLPIVLAAVAMGTMVSFGVPARYSEEDYYDNYPELEASSDKGDLEKA